MEYLVDAQLPKKLKNWLADSGVEATHTLDLPKGNLTSDLELIQSYSSASVVIISKDKDFPHRRIIRGKPELLLWITTGNIVNQELLELFAKNFEYIDASFRSGSKFIELDNVSVIIHE